MIKRIIAILFIYVCTSLAWVILYGTMLIRTETQDTGLKQDVDKLWGTEQTQLAPMVYYDKGATRLLQSLEGSNIDVDIKLEHRKRGLLWYSTYTVSFAGLYEIKNTSNQSQEIFIDFKFPARSAIYDDFHYIIGQQEIQEIELSQDSIVKHLKLEPGQSENFKITYTSHGLENWSYDFGSSVKQVKNFSLNLKTNFEDIDFPTDSLSPIQKQRTSDGWKLRWEYTNLLTGVKIGMIMPHKLNPGPWVSRVTRAAPVSLFLFFFLLLVFTTIRKIKIHPMNYFFIGAAFFSFHLLLAYLVDHISIHLAFWISSLVSVFLVVSYMRLVTGRRFAFIEVALSQLVYLVLFSYTFFFEGYTGLAITILCICTLFIVMQITGRLDWEKVFAKTEQTVKITDSGQPSQ
jgi:inner membrane protein involved in colicin E2 resistance